MCVGSVTAKSQLVVVEVFEVVMGAAGFVAGHAPDAAVDGLAFETMAGCLDFCDDVASCELDASSGSAMRLMCVGSALARCLKPTVRRGT
jgi:hypothetical protein